MYGMLLVIIRCLDRYLHLGERRCLSLLAGLCGVTVGPLLRWTLIGICSYGNCLTGF